MAQTSKPLSRRGFRWDNENHRGLRLSSRIILILLIVTVLSAASIAHLKLTSQATSISYRIRQLEDEKQQLNSDKSQLLYEMAEATHLQSLKERARALGMGPARQIEYVPVSTQPLPATMPSGEIAGKTAGEAVTEAAGKTVDQFSAMDAGQGTESSRVTGWWERLLDQFAAWAEVEPEVTPTRESEIGNE